MNNISKLIHFYKVPELANGFLKWLKRVRSQNFEEAFLAVNNIADLTINMTPAPMRDMSNCTELSSVPRDQSQDLRKNNTSIYTDVHLAPNGTTKNSIIHLESTDFALNQVMRFKSYHDCIFLLIF